MALACAVAACGDSGVATDVDTVDATSLNSGTSMGPTGGPTTSASATEPGDTTTPGSASQGETEGTDPTVTSTVPSTDPSTTVGPTGDPGTDTTDTGPDSDSASNSNSGTDTDASTGSSGGDTTMGVSASDSSTGTTDGSTSTGDEPCPPDQECNGACCTADQVCVELQCQKDCGGPPPCGPQQECCAGNELCYLGECVKPGPACDTQQCATKQTNDCAMGFVCDEDLGLCLPSKADPSCIYKPPAQVFEPKPTFTWGTRKSVNCNNNAQCQTAEVCMANKCTPTWPHVAIAADDKPTATQSSSVAAVVDLDQDCVPEIVFNSYIKDNPDDDGVLRAIRGDTGAKVWSVTDPAWETNGTASPAVGDLDGDGDVEIVIPGETKNILAFTHTGQPLWKSDAYSAQNVSGAAAIANMDGEGDAEVIYGPAVFSSAGKKLFEGVLGKGYNGQGDISCVADLNGDQLPDLIAGKTAYSFKGKVSLNTFQGFTLWNTNLADGFCGIADFNGDKQPEVIHVASGKIYALNGQTGATIAQADIPAGGSGGPPNIADFDGDGVPDVAAAGSSAYIVYKFNGVAFTKLWSAPTDDTSSQVTGSSVFDFDGDGKNEVVYNDEVYIRIYPGVEPACLENPPGPACDGNMTDAEVLFRDKNGSRTRTEYPVIADVDGDFKAEIVFPTNNDGGSGPLDAGLEVWGDSLDNWVTTRPVWNQHTYHITNVIGLV